jgi:hypothetical protein
MHGGGLVAELERAVQGLSPDLEDATHGLVSKGFTGGEDGIESRRDVIVIVRHHHAATAAATTAAAAAAASAAAAAAARRNQARWLEG